MLCVASSTVLLVGGLVSGEERDAIKDIFSLGDIDSVAHFVFCMISTFTAALVFGARIYIPVLVFLAGVLIEVSQLWIPARTASFSDVAIDAAGTLVGFLLALWILRIYRKG